MPFKIVLTLENGCSQLTTVPSIWEVKGKLSWPPKKKNIFKLVRDEHAQPNSDWNTLECILKRSNFSSYEEAEKEIALMMYNTDTDNCIEESPQPQIQHRSHINTQNYNKNKADTNVQVVNVTEQTDFDALAENLVEHDPSTNVNLTASEQEPVVYQVCSNENLLLANQNVFSHKMDLFMNLLQTQGNDIQKMGNKLALVSVRVEEMIDKLNQINENNKQNSVTLLKDVRKDEDNESFSFNVIDSQQGLDLLELTLANKIEYKKLKRQLSFLCSSRMSVGKGITCSYKLLDFMISREFITVCSWSGGSRGERSKVAIKNYKLFLKFFFELVHSWDNAFSMEETEHFFKNVLKNATKRTAMKNLRASAKKTRKSTKEISAATININETKSDDSREEGQLC